MPSLPEFPAYIDGDPAAPELILQTPKEYPFQALGDNTTAVYTKTFRVLGRAFSPTALGTVDLDNAGHYLIGETKLEWDHGPWGTFTRTYAAIPPEQTDYSTIAITLPELTSRGGEEGAGRRFGAGGSDTLFTAIYMGSTAYADNVMYALVSGTGSSPIATGGTFTLTYKSSTTAGLAYNADSSTIESAINALSDVVSDGITFAANNTLGAAVNRRLELQSDVPLSAPVTMDASSLSPTSARTVHYETGLVGSGSYVTITIAHRFTVPGHGFDEADALILVNPNMTGEGLTVPFLLVPSGLWEVVDTSTIAILHGIYDPSLYTLVGDPTSSGSYLPGTYRIVCRLVSNYYLPGVSPGISTPADIPIPARSGIDALVDALLAGETGTIVYDVSDFVRWRGGPIIELTTTEINLEHF